MSDRSIAAIIPCLDEQKRLPGLVAALRGEGIEEIVVVDGGSRDRTIETARRLGALVVATNACRGSQLNLGARQSRARLLFFLHADSRVRPGTAETILKMTANRPCLGAFRLAIEEEGARRWRRAGYGIIALGANLRSRLFRLPYGDQGFFMTRKTFEMLGGFQPLDRCEDLDLILRARRRMSILIAKSVIATSGRGWTREGLFRLTLSHWREAVAFMVDFHRRIASGGDVFLNDEHLDAKNGIGGDS